MSKVTNPDVEMSVTCGFYNAVDHDRRYDATEMSTLFDGIINDGVFANLGDSLIVRPYEGNIISVGTGRAWFNSTWTKNDSPLLLNMGESEYTLDRIDAVILEVNTAEQVRDNYIKVIHGSPSTNPKRPVMEDSEYVHQHPLAYIKRVPGRNYILGSDITNAIGTEETPFITGILQVISMKALLGQWDSELDEMIAEWRSEYDQYNTEQTQSFEQWFERLKNILNDDVAGELLRRMVQCEDTIEGFRTQINNLYFSVTSQGVLRITYDDGN